VNFKEISIQLTQALELPGAAAWCACTEGHEFVHHCYTDWFKPEQLEAMVSKLASALTEMNRWQIEPSQACWVFEHARIFLARRADGTALALFVENRPELNFKEHHAALGKFIQPHFALNP
jgi:hypothetical protein